MSAIDIRSKLDDLLRSKRQTVDSWTVEEDEDSTGERGVWVWVVLKNADTDLQLRDDLRTAIQDVVQTASDGEVWAYVRFRHVDEVRDVGGPGHAVP